MAWSGSAMAEAMVDDGCKKNGGKGKRVGGEAEVLVVGEVVRRRSRQRVVWWSGSVGMRCHGPRRTDCCCGSKGRWDGVAGA